MNNKVLELKNIVKVFPNGVVANKGINFSFEGGEIHAIVGENGAGKSTLMKIIYGAQAPSEGEIILNGKPVHFSNSMEAIKAGIGMVYQQFMLVPSMTVMQNIIMGDEPKNLNFLVDYKKAQQVTSELSEKYNLGLDVTKKVSELSAGEKQKVEILKTLYRNAKIIILDEPTSVLTPQETDALFVELRKLREMGHTIIFISHKLNEVKRISDRISVIRSGESKGTYLNEEIDLNKLAELIVGREIKTSYDDLKTNYENKNKVLEVKNISSKNKNRYVFKNISFSINSGEILGVAGVQGNGQSELVKTIVGLNSLSEGEIYLNGTKIDDKSISEKRKLGLSYIPEERLTYGVAGKANLGENLISTYYDRKDINNKLFMDHKKIDNVANNLINKYSIRTKSSKMLAENLSGGNMQKVVVAREANSKPVCMIAEQPTQGIDIGSSEYIRSELIKMRNEGASILLVSADLDEVMNVSDKLIVMYDGQITAYFDSLKNVSANEIGLYMLGAEKQSEEKLKGASL